MFCKYFPPGRQREPGVPTKKKSSSVNTLHVRFGHVGHVLTYDNNTFILETLEFLVKDTDLKWRIKTFTEARVKRFLSERDDN